MAEGLRQKRDTAKGCWVTSQLGAGRKETDGQNTYSYQWTGPKQITSSCDENYEIVDGINKNLKKKIKTHGLETA